jgi:hypothetical protein
MLAATAGFGVANRNMLPALGDKMSITRKGRQAGAVGGEEDLAVERDEGVRR